MQVRDAAPAPALSSPMPQAPAPAASSPAPLGPPAPGGFASAIARSGLGAASTEGDVAALTFGAPAQDGVPAYVPFSTAPITVSREEAAPAPEPAPAATATATESAPAPAAAPAGATGGDPEKLFEDLYDRLKRELLLEQEQLGQAFREM
jgi:hypothetical protein